MTVKTILEFTYDKQDGSAPKERKVLVVSHPSDSYAGYEFNQLSELDNYFKFLEECDKLRDKYGIADLKYKRFKVNKMSQLTESKVK